MHELRELYHIANKKHWFIVVISKIVAVIGSYLIPFCFSLYITAPLTEEKIFRTTIALAIVFVVTLLANWLYYYYGEVFYGQVQFSISRYYFNQMIEMKMSDLNKMHTGFVRNQLGNLTASFIAVFKGVLEVYIPVFIGLASFLAVAFNESVILGGICTLLFAIAIIIRHRMILYSQPAQRKRRDYYAAFEGTLVDFIQNIRTVKKEGMKVFANRRLDDRVDEYLDVLQTSEKIQGNIFVMFNGLINMAYIFILISAWLTLRQGGDPFSFIVFYISIMGKVKGSMEDFVQSMAVVVNFRHIKAQIETYVKKEEKEEEIEGWKHVEIRRARFYYDDKTLGLDIPEFSMEKGQNISIYGESGSGKTTLLNILSGIYELRDSSFYVDGQVKTSGRLSSVYISQDTELFDMTIKENITLGNKVDEFLMNRLIRELGLGQWIGELNDGLNTMVGEKGTVVSTGQKQRLLILRAILMDKELYFFDEPTSNLDEQSERQVLHVLNQYLGHKTIIIATNRMAMMEICQKHYHLVPSNTTTSVRLRPPLFAR